MPPDGVLFTPDGRSAALEVKNLAVIDQPKWPAHGAPTTPAVMSYRVVWKATDEKIVYEDKLKHFRVDGYRATARVEAAVEIPSLGYSWRSDPIETSGAAFAIIGEEVNGKYYDT